jgi:hypothetical protein
MKGWYMNMGIDWKTCNCCGDTFPDCGDYIRCKCDTKWCGKKCAESEGYKDENAEKPYDEDLVSCSWCRNELFTDNELLSYALTILNLTREQLISKLRNLRNQT